MRIFVFRPQADCERTAAAISARGHQPVLAPLFTIERLEEAAPQGSFAAIVLTSGNAVPALAEGPSEWRELPVFTVGARSAARARAAGFDDARSADGNRDDLIDLVASNVPSPARRLIVTGKEHHEDLPARLGKSGYETMLWTAYAAKAVDTLPEAAKAALETGQVDAALHYSPRGAETFLRLAKDADLLEPALALTHVALSADVAAPLIMADASTVLVAEHPEEAGMLAALDEIVAPGIAKAAASQAAIRRVPLTIELPAHEVSTSEPVPPEEHAPEAVLPTEALPAEFTPPGQSETETTEAAPDGSAPQATPLRPAPTALPPEGQRSLWPAVAAAALVGGAVGAGLVMLAWSRATPAVDPAEIAGLRSRVDALQGTANAADRRATAAADAAGKAGAEAQSATTRIAEFAKLPPAPALDTGVIAGLAQRLDQTAARIGSVETLAKSAATPSAQSLAAARIVLAERIRAAIGSGKPFAEDVAALAKGGGTQGEIAALNAVAATGAPTGDALLVGFRAHRAMFARELTPLASDWQTRLLTLASRVVTIRPVGDTGANDPATLPIRLENALSNGDIVTAAALWAQLPEPARRASAEFGENLRKRAAADAAIAKIAQDAVAALGAAG